MLCLVLVYIFHQTFHFLNCDSDKQCAMSHEGLAALKDKSKVRGDFGHDFC